MAPTVSQSRTGESLAAGDSSGRGRLLCERGIRADRADLRRATREAEWRVATGHRRWHRLDRSGPSRRLASWCCEARLDSTTLGLQLRLCFARPSCFEARDSSGRPAEVGSHDLFGPLEVAPRYGFHEVTVFVRAAMPHQRGCDLRFAQ